MLEEIYKKYISKGDVPFGDGTFRKVPFRKLYVSSLVKSFREKKTFENLKTYCMFIGYSRSGHSLIGSIIDSHPNALLAHELDTLQFIESGYPFNKFQIYYLIHENSVRFTKSRRKWAGFSFFIPGSWQGRFTKLSVIGDKKGGISTLKLMQNQNLLDKLQQLVGINVKFIHVVRNPFDNISTIAIKEGRSLDNAINYYFASVATNKDLEEKIEKQNLLNFRLESLIQNPDKQLNKLFSFLGLKPSDKLLKNCQAILFKKYHQSRYDINWDEKQINLVEKTIERYEFLKGYKFNN